MADEPAPVSGFFLSHPHGDFVVVSAAAEESVRRVLYHEVLHRFVRHHLPEAPLWLNEGLAEFYSTLEVGRGEAWIGAPVVEHVVHLQRGPRRPLAELLAIATDATGPSGFGTERGARGRSGQRVLRRVVGAGPPPDRGRGRRTRRRSRATPPACAPARSPRPRSPPSSAISARSTAASTTSCGARRASRSTSRSAQPARYVELQAPSVAAADLDAELGWLLSHHSPALRGPRAHALRVGARSRARARRPRPPAWDGSKSSPRIATRLASSTRARASSTRAIRCRPSSKRRSCCARPNELPRLRAPLARGAGDARVGARGLPRQSRARARAGRGLGRVGRGLGGRSVARGRGARSPRRGLPPAAHAHRRAPQPDRARGAAGKPRARRRALSLDWRGAATPPWWRARARRSCAST